MGTVDIVWLWPTAALVLGYLLGAIPFGLLLTRIAGAGDLRQVGSGNIGATNVLRTGRKGLAAATLLLDVAKGAVAVIAARAVDPDFAVLGAAGAFLGHCYPVWLRFRGGKGIATYGGVALAIAWPVGLIYAAVWVAMLALTRFSSAAGMAAAVSAPVASAWLGQFEATALFIAFTLIVLWKHRANVERLMAGTEPRVGQPG